MFTCFARSLRGIKQCGRQRSQAGRVGERAGDNLVLLIARGKSMPPKHKKEAEAAPALLGRFGTSLKCGIVGLPNVG